MIPRLMTCACCFRCEEHPNFPGRCIYGGPYYGYRTPDGEIEVLDKDRPPEAPLFQERAAA